MAKARIALAICCAAGWVIAMGAPNKRSGEIGNEIANQARYFTAHELAQAAQHGNIAACV
jgi:hypothetical protein